MLLAYIAATAVWASRSWTDTHELDAPEDRSPAFAEYECPAVFGHHSPVRGRQTLSGTKDSAEDPAYPPSGTPCDEQGRHRVLFFVDVAVAGAGMLLLQRSSGCNRVTTDVENAHALQAHGTSADGGG